MSEDTGSDSPLRVVYAGTPAFAVPALQALVESRHAVVAVYTQPDRPAGRGRKLTASPVKQAAMAHGISVYQPTSLRDPEQARQLADLHADVMVVAAYGLILPPAILAVPRLGCVNIHASLLPRWRGAAPIQRAILAGDRQTGISIMQMDAGLDTGAVLLRAACDIEALDTAAMLHDRLADLGAGLIVQALDGLAAGRLSAVPQDNGQASYAAKLDKSEAALDWSRSAAQLARQVRAFNPWPVAQTELAGQAVRIWDARAIDGQGDGRPGAVLRAGRDGIDVATAAGVLRILELQLPGKRRMTVADLLNARPDLRAGGWRFGGAAGAEA